jgi:hypothetical protein
MSAYFELFCVSLGHSKDLKRWLKEKKLNEYKQFLEF